MNRLISLVCLVVLADTLVVNSLAATGQINGVATGEVSGLYPTLFTPYGVVSMNLNYNRIRLPKPFGSADLLLAGPRVDLTFTKNLFWTTLVQYNSQIDNLNINSRLQWRFAPVSDLFVAYTDNYLATNDETFNIGAPKSRSLVFKLTYWLNL